MADDIFETFTEEPDRGDEVPEETPDFGDSKSAQETEYTSPNDSDLTITFKRLFPKISEGIINELLQLVMVSRVFPDTYLQKKFLTVMSFKRRHPEIPIMDLENMVDAAMSIGYNGKSRVEIVVVQGASGRSEDDKGDNSL